MNNQEEQQARQIREDGERDFLNGCPHTANPYTGDTFQRFMWYMGWLDGEETANNECSPAN